MKTDKQSIEVLNKRYQALNEKRIQAETKLETSKAQLEKLRAEAKQEFGTDDVQQLSEKLECMQSENEKMRAGFQQRMDEVESNLEKVEMEFSESE